MMEMYKIYRDDEYDELDTMYPLSYFIGHEYRFKHSDSSDKDNVFPFNYAQTFSSLFTLEDVEKMDKIFRRMYNKYIVRKELYTIDGTDIKTYTLANIKEEVKQVTRLHLDEWLVIKKIAEWYNEGILDKSLVNSFYIKRDAENSDTESGTVEDTGSRGAQQNNPYVTEKSYGTGGDARTTTDVKSGQYKETDTGSRKPNDNNTDWIQQTKTENEVVYPTTTPLTNTSTEAGKEYIKTYGQLSTSLKRTFGEDGHRFDHIIDETVQGFKNRDLLRELPDAFDREGLEWLHLVVADLARELVYLVLEV